MKKIETLNKLFKALQVVDEKDKIKIDTLIRGISFELAKKHHKHIHKGSNKWIPGENYITHAGRIYDHKEIYNIIDSGYDFWLTEGKYCHLFKKRLTNYLGSRYCILTTSGSSANLLAISALTSKELKEKKLNKGDEVLTVAASFPTTVFPIIQNNLVPVFLDVELGSYNINIEDIEKNITKKTKAIFLAHTLGNPFNLEKIIEIKKKYNLWLIEDNCDALGSKWKGQLTGTFGDLSTTSFFPAHHITTGEGGAIFTNNSKLKRIVESFSMWGKDCWCEPGNDNTCGKRFDWKLGDLPYGYDHKFIFSHLGYNLKMTDMQASIGAEQMNKLDEFVQLRQKNWKLLYDELSIFKNNFILPTYDNRSEPSWFGFALTVKNNCKYTKNEIVSFLESKKIRTRPLFAGNIIKQPAMRGISHKVIGNLKNTEYIMNNMFWIGVYPGITKKMIKYISKQFSLLFNNGIKS